MEKGCVKRLLKKKSISLVLVLTGLIGLFGYSIWCQKTYLLTMLIKPVHLTAGEIGEQFLKSDTYVIGDLKDLPIYYTGYDMMAQYSYDGVKMKEQKDYAGYYTYIGDKIVLCEYGSSAKETPEMLMGIWYKCFCMSEEETREFDQLKSQLVSDTKGTESEIKMIDFAPQVLYIYAPWQALYKQLRMLFWLGVTAVMVYLWWQNTVRATFIRGNKKIRRVIAKYGSLKELLDQIEGEECLDVTEDALLTTNWLVHGKSKEIINCNEIVWMYHRHVSITLVEHCRTYIYTKDGRKHRLVSWNVSDIFRIYDKITDSRSWIITGYSKSLMEQWKFDSEKFVMDHEYEWNKENKYI